MQKDAVSEFLPVPRAIYCTFAVMLAFARKVKAHVFVLLPPLEHAPDQIASRPLVTLSVIAVPVLNDFVCVLPTVTLIPAGLETIEFPLRPVAVTLSEAVVGGGGGGADGLTVSRADFVTPPPLTDIVTVVCVLTADVKTLNPPVVDPAGMVTELGTEATAGLLLVTESTASFCKGPAIVTVAKDPCVPVTEVGLSAMEAGCGCGSSVTCPETLVRFQVAVIVTSVFCATLLVGSGREAETLPAGIVTGEGGVAEGESLARVTIAPPAGAWPFSMMMS